MKRCSIVPSSRLSEDPYLAPYLDAIRQRQERATLKAQQLAGNSKTLEEFASGHEYFGLHRDADQWVFREWAPHATSIELIGTFCDWDPGRAPSLRRVNDHGEWELRLPGDALQHEDLYRLHVSWPGGQGSRIPSHARRVVQDPASHIFNAQVWNPPRAYAWQYAIPDRPSFPLVYEAHVGMAQERADVGTYVEFRENIVPRIRKSGYNTIQLMGVMEHPYYASFGYHVANFFAASSRFGTPEELKQLIDAAHGAGLRVIIDLVHSHVVKNEAEGLARFDGTSYQYFHQGPRGDHAAWDSRCFDYGKPEVLHFLLSNCRFWLDEYRVDGFRFDGVTSMLYLDHGLGTGFASYDAYFGANVDEDAVDYLALANQVIHRIRPDATTIAEDVSGMPGLAAPAEDTGIGFDYRLAMGVPDCWFKLVNDVPDEQWDLAVLWRELNNTRKDECAISYAESHDQALVGGKTLMFEMADADMYQKMGRDDQSLTVDRAMALHKMIRLATAASAPHGYLNFIGNEFGHPEWIDFPREGNGWSYQHARRQWSLRDNPNLKYSCLGDFDQAMLELLVAGRPAAYPPQLVRLDVDGKLLAVARGSRFFLFNFHPDRSLADYGIEVPAGDYRLILDTDTPGFGGQGRIADGQVFHAVPAQTDNAITHHISVYLPSRTAMVLERT